MKIAIGFLALALGFNAFAGPEEHLQNQSCYVIQPSTINVPKNIPTEICLEDIYVSAAAHNITVFSYFQAELFKDLKLDQLVRKTENLYTYKASKYIYTNFDMICSYGEQNEMTIEGVTDITGRGNPAQVTITVSYNTTRDNCHTDLQEEALFTYKLR